MCSILTTLSAPLLCGFSTYHWLHRKVRLRPACQTITGFGRVKGEAVRSLQMNSDYENQETRPRTCTCERIRDVREAGEVICILRAF